MPDLFHTEDTAARYLESLARNYEKQVQLIYRDTLNSIQGEMTSLYQKYAQDGNLTYAEMSKYNRLKSMEDSIISQMDEATKQTIRTIDHMRPDLYQEAFYHYAWAMDNGNGVRLNYGVINKDIIAQNLINPFYTDVSRIRLPMVVRTATMSALNTGLAAGKSYEKMAADLRNAANIANYNAMRIIRTEAHTAINAGQDLAYERAQAKGIEGNYIWDATLDGRTRPTHAAMDQAIRKEDGLFDGPGSERCPYPGYFDLSAEERIHCRCRLRFQVGGYSPQLRRSRDEGVIPYETYAHWKDRRFKTPEPRAVK